MREGWTYKKLEEVCDVYQPKTLATEQLISDGKYFVYGANGVIGRYNDYNHEDSEVLLTCRGATCGTINISEPFSWINGNAMVIHRKSDELSFMYLKYLMSSLDYSNIITGAAQPQITRQKLAPTIVAVPPKSQQEAIVSELDEINSLLALKREQLQKYDKLAQSLFYEMFGDPVENEKGWEVKKMSDVCSEIGDGLHGTPEYAENTGYYFVNGNNLENGKIVIKQETKQVTKEVYKKYFIELDSNTVLISINGTLGKTAFYGGERIMLGKSACYLRVNSDLIEKNYLISLLSSNFFKNYMEEECTGTTIKNFSLKSMRSYTFGLPPLPLQQQFASRIEQIESQKQQVQASIEKLETLLASRMQYWFE